MGQYTSTILQFLKYALKVLPELRQQKRNILSHNTCRAHHPGNATTGIGPEASIAVRFKAPLLCSSFFSFYPGIDMKNFLSFILSFYSLADRLSEYRDAEGIWEEPDMRKLYGCLSGAVDPSRTVTCRFDAPIIGASIQKRETSSVLCLSDHCRLQLAVLPSFSLAAPKLKKYVQYHIDLHSYMYYPEAARMERLQIWSDTWLKRYQEISCMEFCAASDSLLGITAMYAAASTPGLSAAYLKLLDEACFPWLCGLESLLRSYAELRDSENTPQLNYCSTYKNLKECEQRICFFLAKAEEACLRLKESSFYSSLIRFLLGMYLSDPKTNFGMFRLTSQSIMKKNPRQSSFYINGCRLLRFCRYPA